MYRITYANEVEHIATSVSFLQSEFWSCFKSLEGWICKYFLYGYENNETKKNGEFYLSVLLRRIKPFGYIAYIPMLPNIIEDDASDIQEERSSFLSSLSASLFNLLPKNVFLIRMDPAWQEEVENACGKASLTSIISRPKCTFGKRNGVHIKKARVDIQPPDTIILDITQTDDALLGQFKSKWRYNIRLSEKKGCHVHCVDMKDDESIAKGIDLFYELYKTTAKRDGIAIHSKKYYASLFMLAKDKDKNYLRLYVATYNNINLAAIICIFYEEEATYLYGASCNQYRNLMPTYLLQYIAIKDAKKASCKTYDFYGIPPNDNPKHPMAGLYRFKSGFGGKIIHRIGSIDSYKNPFLYAFYSIAERARSFYFKSLKKIFVRRK